MKLEENAVGWKPARVPLWKKVVDAALITAVGIIAFLIMLMICRGVGWCQEAPKSWQVTFKWDARTEEDLAGYRLYGSDTAGGQVLGKGHELAEMSKDELTKTLGFEEGDKWFVLTAFDTSGNESGKSNEVKLHLDEVAPGEPTLKINIILQVEVTTP